MGFALSCPVSSASTHCTDPQLLIFFRRVYRRIVLGCGVYSRPFVVLCLYVCCGDLNFSWQTPPNHDRQTPRSPRLVNYTLADDSRPADASSPIYRASPISALLHLIARRPRVTEKCILQLNAGRRRVCSSAGEEGGG